MFCFPFFREWIRGLYDLVRECSWNCYTKLSRAAVHSVQVGILLEKHWLQSGAFLLRYMYGICCNMTIKVIAFFLIVKKLVISAMLRKHWWVFQHLILGLLFTLQFYKIMSNVLNNIKLIGITKLQQYLDNSFQGLDYSLYYTNCPSCKLVAVTLKEWCEDVPWGPSCCLMCKSLQSSKM
jgi:hypothetical protein